MMRLLLLFLEWRKTCARRAAKKAAPTHCRIVWICRCCGEENNSEWFVIAAERQLLESVADVNERNKQIRAWVQRRKLTVIK